MTTAPAKLHRVVIVGAGFGGLETTYRLAGAPVEITLIDRRNHHLFQPLLYQVATASLATSEIAWPIRYLLRNRPEVTTLFANVNSVDAGLVDWAARTEGIEVVAVPRNADVKGFQVLPRRWVVERTFGWLTRCRRLGRDYER